MYRAGVEKKDNNEDWKIGNSILYLITLKCRIFKINLGPYNTSFHCLQPETPDCLQIKIG